MEKCEHDSETMNEEEHDKVKRGGIKNRAETGKKNRAREGGETETERKQRGNWSYHPLTEALGVRVGKD